MKNSGFDYEINLDANCIFVRHYGIFDLNQVIERGNRVAKHPDFRKSLNRIIDITTCEVDFSADEIRAVWSRINKEIDQRGSYKEVLLVSSPLAHGLGRMFDSLSPVAEVQIRVYNTKEHDCFKNLRKWLGLVPDIRFPDFMATE
ncbi:MAG: hypothetical protein MI743_12925 [Sneathiellales bacterium]|nr:hypothetical protein [Sneathiellales bacterium]